MKTPLTILGIAGLVLMLFWWFGPDPDPSLEQPRSDLPWQVQAQPDGTARVFDLTLGEATLQDASNKFGPYEGTAVFVAKDGKKSLEVYFGTVTFGPLKAKVVTTLEVPDAELEALLQQAVEREGSPSGDWKFRLPQAVNDAQGRRPIRSITYIPGYRGLDADFFRQRLGEPAAWKTIDDQSVLWFYPDKGVSLLLHAKGKEVLEYRAPRDFTLPEDAKTEGNTEPAANES